MATKKMSKPRETMLYSSGLKVHTILQFQAFLHSCFLVSLPRSKPHLVRLAFECGLVRLHVIQVQGGVTAPSHNFPPVRRKLERPQPKDAACPSPSEIERLVDFLQRAQPVSSPSHMTSTGWPGTRLSIQGLALFRFLIGRLKIVRLCYSDSTWKKETVVRNCGHSTDGEHSTPDYTSNDKSLDGVQK
jgi:hypothetical protein